MFYILTIEDGKEEEGKEEKGEEKGRKRKKRNTKRQRDKLLSNECGCVKQVNRWTDR